jgi:hypothetical protein
MALDFNAIIRTLLFTPGVNDRWGLPALFEGEPGTAKTATLGSDLRAEGLRLFVLLGSLSDPADIGGYPMQVGGVMHRATPMWARAAADAVHAVIFADELNTSAPAVQAALLRVVLEGAVADFVLPKTVRFIAAQNPTDQAAGGWDLAPPLANRFGHFAWQAPSTEQWNDWLLSGASIDGDDPKDAAQTEKRVMELWPTPWARARGQVAGFMMRRPELLHRMPKVDDPKASKAWPSRRTWEMACRAVAGAEVHRLGPVETDVMISAFIGEGAAAEFATYRTQADLPDPTDVLDRGVKFKHEARRMDRTAAVLNSCTALVVNPSCALRDERAAVLWNILLDVQTEGAADLVVGPARTLLRAALGSSKDARVALAKLEPVLRDAGIRG